jgi:hypothetical protein
MGLFVAQYQTKKFNVVGAEEQECPAPLDELDAQLVQKHSCAKGDANHYELQVVAREGIEHFVAFCRSWLEEHPPETHIMLAQGFGVRLRGGYDVSLTPTVYADLGGTMENAPSVPVTLGLGSPGMRGVEQTPSYAVTGEQPHPGLRSPGA